MTYRVDHVVNLLLYKARQSGKQLTHLQLQKLLWFMYGWHLVNTGKELFGDKFKAWDLGMICEPVYHCFKACGSRPIPINEYMPEPHQATTLNCYWETKEIKQHNEETK